MASRAGLAAYAVAGLWQPVVTRYSLLSFPLVLLGVWTGRVLNQRRRGAAFFRAVYLGLIAIGVIVIAQASMR